jgi:hypothetical protein
MSKRTIYILGASLAMLLVSTCLAAQELTVALTGQQVSCNEGQLGRLLARTTATGAPLENSPPTLTTLVSYSNSVGFYDGLAVANEGARCNPGPPPLGLPEHYLAFNINPSLRALLLNPRRPPLGQAELSREETSSNFVSPNDNDRIVLTINPTLASSADSGLLMINNFLIPAIGSPYNGFLASSTKPGRGLSDDALLTPCHAAFTAQDRKIFAILQRMVRVLAVQGNCNFDTKIAIFRATDPHTYRIDVYVQDLNGAFLGKAAAVLQIDWTSAGVLTSGTLSMLPACSGNSPLACSTVSILTWVYLIAPVLGGSERRSGEQSWAVNFDPAIGRSQPVAVDLTMLLRGSTWNQ